MSIPTVSNAVSIDKQPDRPISFCLDTSTLDASSSSRRGSLSSSSSSSSRRNSVTAEKVGGIMVGMPYIIIQAPNNELVSVDYTHLYPISKKIAVTDEKGNISQVEMSQLRKDLSKAKAMTDLRFSNRVDNRPIVVTKGEPYSIESDKANGSWRAVEGIEYKKFGFIEKELPDGQVVFADPDDKETHENIDKLIEEAAKIEARRREAEQHHLMQEQTKLKARSGCANLRHRCISFSSRTS